MESFSEYIPEAMYAAILGKDQILAAFGKQQQLFSKGIVNAYTETDLSVERLARAYLNGKTHLPFYGEEEGGDLGTKLLWMADKIDGTMNFRAGVENFASAISLLHENECVISAIHLPALHQLYVGVKGYGAYKFQLEQDCGTKGCAQVRELWSNRKPAQRISASKENDPKKMPVAWDVGYTERVQKLTLAQQFVQEFSYCPIYGSAAYAMCKIASGGLGAYVGIGLDVQDIYNGLALVTEAGCKVSDVGTPITRDSRTLIIGANKVLHDFLVEKMKN